MGRHKGGSKTGGRQKGAPNKSTLYRTKFEQILANYDGGKGFDPITEIIDVFVAIKFDNPLAAAKIAMPMIEFMHPRKRSVDANVKTFTPIRIESDDGRNITIEPDTSTSETE